MSASDALSGVQFVHHSEIAKMYSGDYDEPMSKVLPVMRGVYRQDMQPENDSAESPESYYEHGGPDRYVSHLAKDIAKNGMHEPITVRGTNVISDGHHRALAAMRLKMDRVPIRNVR